jgi:N-acetylneuraminic acid mutarotase
MKKRISIVLVLVLGFVSVSLAVEDTWTTKANIPRARYVLSSSVVDGIIYAIGGDAGSRASVVEAYNPLTDTWTRKSNMPMGRGAGTTSVVNGKIYYMGGRLNFNGANISSVIEYDPVTDTWATKPNRMPTPRTWLSSSVVNGKIYTFGGAQTYQGAPLFTVEEYDPATDTWTTKSEMPTARASVSTNAVNGRIYAIGGTPGYNQWNQGLTTVEEYDPSTDTWATKTDMPTPRTYFSTCVVNGKIYAIGGVKSGGADHVALVEEYDPATDTWIRVADIPTARSGLATCAVNGKIYAIGGWVGSGAAVSTVEEYDTGLTISSPDFNGDGIVDSLDMCIMIDHWGEDYSLCDIGPTLYGDGIIDVQDLIVLSEYLFEKVEDPTLIAHWPLDETEGDVAYDSAGKNDAFLVGDPAWQPAAGQIDGALQLDGISGYALTGEFLSPAVGPFSVLVWINGGAPGQVVVSQQNAANWLAIDHDGNLMTEITGSGRSGYPLYSETVITDGQWHKIGFVWDGLNRKLYVDGVVVAEDTQPDLEGSEMGLNIGTGKAMEPGTFFSGLIDDIRIYNRVVKP